jgi:uncharacterized protein (TIGR02391 family)
MNLETEINQDLWLSIRRSYETRLWSNAILDAIHFLSDALRTKTGLQSDGAALVGQALGGKNPKLRLNRLQTDSEKDVQRGVEQLLRGIYSAFRNPRSHERPEDTEADADVIIVFINYLLRLIGHAGTDFSLETCVQHVLEENFVPTARYAKLLVSEIPSRHRLDVFLTVFQRKHTADGQKLRYFFDEVLSQLSADEQEEAFRAISDELRETNEESVIRAVLAALDPEYWPRLDEIARLRIEHRLIRSMEDGRYSTERKRCSGGGLATWAIAFFSKFTLKEDAHCALVGKLQSNSTEAQDYVFEYFIGSLEMLIEKPTWSLQYALIKGLKAGDSRFKEATDGLTPISGENPWGKQLREALAAFKPAEPVPMEGELMDEDDVPPF